MTRRLSDPDLLINHQSYGQGANVCFVENSCSAACERLHLVTPGCYLAPEYRMRDVH
jgi:hypothetical protein